MTATATLKVDGNQVQVIDLESGVDLLKCIPVEHVQFNISMEERRISLEVSPWAFVYDLQGQVGLTFKGQPIKAIIVGEDVASETIPVDELLKELRDGK